LLDQKLFGIAGAIESNLLTFINPLNVNEQKKIFFEHLARNEPYNPVFTYIQRDPSYSYFSKNSRLDIFRVEVKDLLESVQRDELGVVFESEMIDLLEKIELIKSIDTINFAGNSESYYGSFDKKTLDFAKKIIQQPAEENNTPVSFDSAINEIKNFLKSKNLHYDVVLREPAGAKFAVINSRREILINKDTVFSAELLKRLIAHEIETHIYRYENGLRQPFKILAHGFSRETTETEEGLAVCVEELKGVSSQTQIKDYAGRLYAIDVACRNDFYNTFCEMHKYFDDDNAFRLTLRAKRGISDQSKNGAFFKDALYFKGMIKVKEFLENHKIEELYCGKYAVEDIPLVRSIPGLKEPKLLPSF
jgi:uncharacterized protein (TIGR02421 family)